jgi:hypothetical protein
MIGGALAASFVWAAFLPVLTAREEPRLPADVEAFWADLQATDDPRARVCQQVFDIVLDQAAAEAADDVAARPAPDR